jgi:hypothetical protein
MKQDALGRTNRLLSFDPTRTAEKTKKLWGRHKHGQQGDFVSLFFSQNKKIRIKNKELLLEMKAGKVKVEVVFRKRPATVANVLR